MLQPLSYLPLLTVFLSFVPIIITHAKEAPAHKNSRINKELLEWEAPESLKKQLPYYLSGFDYEGRPVLVLEWGKWKFQEIAEEGGEVESNAIKFMDQLRERIKTGFFQQNFNDGPLDNETAIIIDFDGLHLSQLGSPETVHFMLNRVATMGKIYNYVAYGFIVNANPHAHFALNISKPMFGKLLEKVEIYGTNPQKWIPRILKQIPTNSLPRKYGGPIDFKPIAFYG